MAVSYSDFAGVVNEGASTILGLTFQGVNDRRQIRQQAKLNAQQLEMDKALGIFNREQAMKMWEDTNYGAQADQMRKAGLNVGLMYKSAGGGGVTMQPNSNFNAPHAPSGGGEIGMGIQMGLMAQQVKANTELANAQADLARAEAEKKRGVDTSETQSRIGKLIAETNNEILKSRLQGLEADILEIEKTNRPYRIKAEIENVMENTNKLRLENGITSDGYNDIVNTIRETAIGKALENELTEAKTKLTNTEIQQIKTGIVQKWTELGLSQRSLDQKDRDIKIKQFEAEISAEYPNAWSVLGGVMKKAYDSLESIETWISGKEPKVDKVK